MKKPMDEAYKLFIDGEWVDGEGGRTFDATCPANGEKLATCAEASKEDVDRAVKAAWRAFGEWRKVSAPERSAILHKIADAIQENAEKLAMIEAMDVGKPIRETQNIDIPFAVNQFRYFAGVVLAEEGQAFKLNNDILGLILREPIGVVGQIVPWNFPLNLTSWKLAPALAAGNCCVLKPSSAASLSGLELAKLMQPILPPGVINVVTGRGSTTGSHVLAHPEIRKLSFTGSTEVGFGVAKAAADKLIPSTMELGGKSANIYFADMPWEKAVDGVCLGILFNQGEVCASGSRVFVQEEVYDKFLDAVVEKFKSVKVGFPWDPTAMMSSVISEDHLQKILSYIDIGKMEGARIATGGNRVTGNGFERGAFMQPTILADVRNDMRVAQEEIFGPVACFIKFKSEEEVISMANDNEYGLAGAVWTKDINRAFRVAQGVETGTMWVNTYNYFQPGLPFGGCKKSGFGKETHKMVMDSYTQKKAICIHMTEAPSGFY